MGPRNTYVVVVESQRATVQDETDAVADLECAKGDRSPQWGPRAKQPR